MKFLGLPEDELLTAFNLEYKSLASESPLSKTVDLSENKTFPWLRIVLIIITCVIVWFAYQQWEGSSVESLPEISDNSLDNERAFGSSFNESIVEPIVPLDDTSSVSTLKRDL